VAKGGPVAQLKTMLTIARSPWLEFQQQPDNPTPQPIEPIMPEPVNPTDPYPVSDPIPEPGGPEPPPFPTPPEPIPQYPPDVNFRG
jgi:hypothetical protein